MTTHAEREARRVTAADAVVHPTVSSRLTVGVLVLLLDEVRGLRADLAALRSSPESAPPAAPDVGASEEAAEAPSAPEALTTPVPDPSLPDHWRARLAWLGEAGPEMRATVEWLAETTSGGLQKAAANWLREVA